MMLPGCCSPAVSEGGQGWQRSSFCLRWCCWLQVAETHIVIPIFLHHVIPLFHSWVQPKASHPHDYICQPGFIVDPQHHIRYFSLYVALVNCERHTFLVQHSRCNKVYGEDLASLVLADPSLALVAGRQKSRQVCAQCGAALWD